MKKIKIESTMAHFKNGQGSLNQRTHTIVPISTVVGILKNIYGETIEDFTFGYNLKYEDKIYEYCKYEKEVNRNAKRKKENVRTPVKVEYLIGVTLTIYTDIDKEIELNSSLNLGKTNCLAKATFEDVDISDEECEAYGLFTETNEGNGVIERINVETKFNEEKGYYDYYTRLFRSNENSPVMCSKSYEGEGIYFWRYKKEGDIKCLNYKE